MAENEKQTIHPFATVNILGTFYRIEITTPDKDVRMADKDGLTDPSTKRILINDFSQVREEDPADALDNKVWFRDQVMRHEIIHAFLTESGCVDAFWHTEDMVNWLAYMEPRLHAAFVDAGCAGINQIATARLTPVAGSGREGQDAGY